MRSGLLPSLMKPARWWFGVAVVSAALLGNAALLQWTGLAEIRMDDSLRRVLREPSRPLMPELPSRFCDPPPRVDPLPERALQAPLIGAT